LQTFEFWRRKSTGLGTHPGGPDEVCAVSIILKWMGVEWLRTEEKAAGGSRD
jgi:hypothetical protein